MCVLATARITCAALTLVSALTVLPPVAGAYRSGFSLYARALMGEDRKPVLKVSTQIPHANLIFLRRDDVFEARYRLYIRVFDEKGKRLVDSAVLRKRVVVADYRETRSSKHSSALSHRFAVQPGSYVVRCTIHVKDTHLSFSKETFVTVPNIEKAGVGLSKPRLFAVEIDTSRYAAVLRRQDKDERIYVEQKEPAAFAEYDKQPAFQFDIYLEKTIRDSVRCDLAYEVVDENDTQTLYGKKTVKLSGEDQFIVSFNVDEWEPGRYVCKIKASLSDPPRAAVSKLRFDLEFTQAMLTRHLERTIEILSLIADKNEIEEFRSAPDEERGAVWVRFWERRDPSPGTKANESLEEHWRRLRYVAANFATSEPGWKTDRGKVYIRYGEPDEIEIRNDPYVQGEYLIWRYYEPNLTFVFYDRFGLGEYRLSNSSAF